MSDGEKSDLREATRAANRGWELLTDVERLLGHMDRSPERDAIRALLLWCRQLEERPRHDAEQAATLPPARPIDANTAALIQAGERREQAKPCPCGGAFELKGAQLVCDKCGRAVRVKARSLKQVTR